MANHEHLELLKQGVEVWNKWRQEYPDLQPDLTGAALAKADLSGAILTGTLLKEANLMWADLRGTLLNEAHLDEALISWANLNGATLIGATLNEADLRQANLHKADLSGSILIWALLNGADLSGATLVGATLRGTSLRGADLSRADLSSTDLSSADLSGAKLSFTTFGRVDLSTVKGLDILLHLGPSIIDTVTLSLSRGTLPEGFLRGAGVPDSFIAALRTPVGSLIDSSACLLRYASEDRAFAERLHTDLESRGVRCWLAPHDPEAATVIRASMDEALRLYDKLVLILSKNTVTSSWVEYEVNIALSKELPRRQTVLFPVLLDSAVLNSSSEWANYLRHRSVGNFTQWTQHDSYQRAFQSLLRDLKATMQPGT